MRSRPAVGAVALILLALTASPAEADPGAASSGGTRVAAAAVPVPTPAAPADPAVSKTSVSPTAEPVARKPVVKKVAPPQPTLVARIDLTRQRMTVRRHGKVIHSWKISSGRRGYATPPGRFRPSWASKMWYSRQYNGAPMPYAVFFNRGIATHGTNAVSRLGRPASHGCIRLRTPHARRFYQLVHRHGYKRTKIIVTGRAKFSRKAKRKVRGRSRRATVRRSTRRSVRGTHRGVRRSAPRRRARLRRVSSTGTYAQRRDAAQRAYLRRRYGSRFVYPGDRPRLRRPD